MNVYMVIYILGEIAATVGPVSLEQLERCHVLATQQEADFDEAWSTKNLDAAPEMHLGGRRVRREDVSAVCEIHSERPAIIGEAIVPEKPND